MYRENHSFAPTVRIARSRTRKRKKFKNSKSTLRAGYDKTVDERAGKTARRNKDGAACPYVSGRRSVLCLFDGGVGFGFSLARLFRRAAVRAVAVVIIMSYYSSVGGVLKKKKKTPRRDDTGSCPVLGNI